MKLLVVVVTYNAMQWAERCFNSLLESTHRPDVFVVDNGSTDGTQKYIKAHYPEVFFQQSDINLGFGKANNIGLQYALENGFDYVYLLNQDAWVMPDTFERLISFSVKYPEFGILSPFQMNADMYHIDRDFVISVLNWSSNPDIESDLYNHRYKDIYPVMTVMASHWLITRKCLLKIGGFSPSFPHYGEDDNYQDRVHFWGIKVGIVPSLRVVHDRGWREDSIEKKLHLMYTGFIRSLSNPNITIVKGIMLFSYSTLIGMIKYKSLRPIQKWVKIVFTFYSILKNRKISMNKECAFLSKFEKEAITF